MMGNDGKVCGGGDSMPYFSMGLAQTYVYLPRTREKKTNIFLIIFFFIIIYIITKVAHILFIIIGYK
jgi:hypothetical protein